MKFQVLRKINKAAAALIVLILAGCATDNLETALPLLQGKPLSQAVRYLGAQSAEKQVSGKTVYSWINEESESFFAPEGDVSPVSVQGNRTIVFSGSRMSGAKTSYKRSCQLDIATDGKQIIAAGYQGSGTACRIFSDKLKPLVPDADLK